MDIKVKNGCAVLQPKGDLTIFEAADFREALLALSEKQEAIELSLAKIGRIDSSGVQLIVNACREMSLKVSGISPKLQERFDTVGCGQFLETVSGPRST